MREILYFPFKEKSFCSTLAIIEISRPTALSAYSLGLQAGTVEQREVNNFSKEVKKQAVKVSAQLSIFCYLLLQESGEARSQKKRNCWLLLISTCNWFFTLHLLAPLKVFPRFSHVFSSY